MKNMIGFVCILLLIVGVVATSLFYCINAGSRLDVAEAEKKLTVVKILSIETNASGVLLIKVKPVGTADVLVWGHLRFPHTYTVSQLSMRVQADPSVEVGAIGKLNLDLKKHPLLSFTPY